ncbi:MAG: ATP-binding cassette domain-containing protein [Deltaproteobacteria bacterium]|nr:ATP-binding cassette domain-containing protein [Deltaproteobacteria bacterium]
MTPAATEPPVISLEHVTFSYHSEPVLEDVNLTIHNREMIGIIGPNGGGKTTLLRLILGLLEPDRGRVRVFGKPPRQVSNRLGYVPQHMQFDPQFPISVLDVVLMGLAGRAGFGPFPRKLIRSAESVLAGVDLADFRNKSFAELSGGQRQRVLIARALATSPDMLLFDEPTANVDSSAGEKLYEILDQLNKKMTILVASHDIGFVNRHITSVVCVNHQVNVHPTSALDGRNITDLYGNNMALIRHDHRCSQEGHSCSNS